MANGGEWLAAVGFLVRSADANWERQGGPATVRSNPVRDCLATVSMIDTMMDAGQLCRDGDHKG
jgi:hypothetical protein